MATAAARLTRAVALKIARFMLRTARSPLRGVWALAHQAAMRGAAVYVRLGQRQAAVYVKGSFASGEPVYGISDVDLIVVAPGEPGRPGLIRQSVRERWKRLCRMLPPLPLLIQHFWVYEEADLMESTSAPCLTYGLARNDAGAPGRAAFLGLHPLADEMGLQDHPSLYGVRREWRLLAGPDRRPLEPRRDPQSRRIVTWLQLQHWWRYAFAACVDPARPYVPYLCVKLIAEPVRLWLWLVEGEQVGSRNQALRRALRELPEEEEALRLALDLSRALPRSPTPPLAELLPAFVRLSQKLARHLTAATAAAGATEVSLLWGDERELVLEPGARDRLRGLAGPGGEPVLLPLADWRARAVPELPDETFALLDGDLTQPALLAAAAGVGRSGPYPALCSDGLLILPASGGWERGTLRGVQCAATDPVSVALAEGAREARFPNLAGWSACDSARRAVAEHHAWLTAERQIYSPHGWMGEQPDSRDPTLRTLGLLFTAARAALFLESLEAGVPELPLTVAAVAKRLSVRNDGAHDIAQEAYDSFCACQRGAGAPSPSALAAFRELVRGLPAYTPRPTFTGALP